MFVQLVNIRVKPGHVQQFIEAFRINYQGTIQEPGNVRFDVLQDPKDETRFVIYEAFASAKAVDDHKKTEHYRKTVEAIDGILIGPRAKDYYTMIIPTPEEIDR
ncbi:MAG: antibiotic biosynthesis monooxygenase [Rhodospirillales bacterium]|nr:antibiotic biosynthesis monooxygenase [Rhodospirillales bacterium]